MSDFNKFWMSDDKCLFGSKLEGMKSVWNHQQQRADKLEKLLREAVKFLQVGKMQFAPHTTNSEVDYFLDRKDIKEIIKDDT